MKLLRHLLLLVLLACAALVAPAAVPHADAVPAYAEEQTILQREIGAPEPGWFSLDSGRRHIDRHWITPIGREPDSDVILQRGGNTWRTIRNGPLGLASGVVLLGALALILLVWRLVGPAQPVQPSGRRIERFTRTQRIVHWTTAISFVLLAVTGLLILFGKKTLLPLIGHQAFSWLAIVSKYVHNVVGPFFIACSIAMVLAFLRQNFFNRGDWAWARRGGGLLTGEHPPAGYFNAGEKTWFWGGVVLLGLVMSVTGLILDFVVFGQTRYLLQLANYLHIAGATFYIAAAMGHVYLGTVGTPGAYEGMRHGTVDANWAHTHHKLWAEQVER